MLQLIKCNFFLLSYFIRSFSSRCIRRSVPCFVFCGRIEFRYLNKSTEWKKRNRMKLEEKFDWRVIFKCLHSIKVFVELCECVCVSVYVKQIQFGIREQQECLLPLPVYGEKSLQRSTCIRKVLISMWNSITTLQRKFRKSHFSVLCIRWHSYNETGTSIDWLIKLGLLLSFDTR